LLSSIDTANNAWDWSKTCSLWSILSTFYTSFFRRYPFAKKYYCKPKWTREKLRKARLYKKRACKILMKLTPVVNFTYILQAAFSLILFRKKLQIQTVSKKTEQNTRRKKLLLKCRWNWHLTSSWTDGESIYVACALGHDSAATDCIGQHKIDHVQSKAKFCENKISVKHIVDTL
jgi:hypothetical protein